MTESIPPDHRWKHVIGVLLIALSLLIAISLISYALELYSMAQRTANIEGVTNWAGRTGVLIAYGAFWSFGYGAFVLPILLFLAGYYHLRGWPGIDILIRIAAGSVLVFLYCIGASLITYGELEPSRQWGGEIGYVLAARLFLPYLGYIGSFIFIAAGAVVTLILGTDIRFGNIIHTFFGIFNVLRRRDRRTKKPTKRKRVAKKHSEPSRARKIKQESIPPPTKIELPKPQIVQPEGSMPAEESSTPSRPAEILYTFPLTSLLDPPPTDTEKQTADQLQAKAEILEDRLSEFGVQGRVTQILPGPVVTLYEVEPSSGVKVSRITALSDDLAMTMRAKRIRIQAPIPGRGAVGIEIPNPKPALVSLRQILESNTFEEAASKLTLALGKTTTGEPFVADLTKMPHLLIAGATGSGKSVCINTMITSILYKASPQEARFILIDPKMIELSVYNEVPHLLTPVVTEPRKAVDVLKWAVGEMENRYRHLAHLGVRNIDEYHPKRVQIAARLDQQAQEEEGSPEPPSPPLPYIIIIIDELADLMMVASRDIEDAIARLTQMARAVGIHLILATQRPSVDVITGVIKANFPARIAFQVASRVDARTILDTVGAEKLLGRGDMLFLPPGAPEPIRLHGAYISSEEVQCLVEWLSKQRIHTQEIPVFDEQGEVILEGASIEEPDSRDPLFEEALHLVVRHQQGSASLLQRRLKIGYARAARLMDQLEDAGIVGPSDGTSKGREVLVDETYLPLEE